MEAWYVFQKISYLYILLTVFTVVFLIFSFFLKKNKIYSLQNHLKKTNDGKSSLIYTKNLSDSGLIETYGKNVTEAFNKRNQISVESFRYIKEKMKNLSF